MPSDYKNFGWQERFYYQIVRDENDLLRILKYIRNNLQKWKKKNIQREINKRRIIGNRH